MVVRKGNVQIDDFRGGAVVMTSSKWDLGRSGWSAMEETGTAGEEFKGLRNKVP